MPRPLKWALGGVLALASLAVGGTWTYVHLIRADAPERLALDVSGGAGTPTTVAPAAPASVDGTWRVTSGSTAGYRVKEVLFGQDAEAVGRTNAVTGSFALAGTRITAGSFVVDMSKVTSDQARRDAQFRGRIMDVAAHPTSTFRLVTPVDLGVLPADGAEVRVPVTGDLTLRGTTKRITVTLTAQRSGSSVRVLGDVPVVFADWGIPNPSFGPVSTQDHGELEFLLVFTKG